MIEVSDSDVDEFASNLRANGHQVVVKRGVPTWFMKWMFSLQVGCLVFQLIQMLVAIAGTR